MIFKSLEQLSEEQIFGNLCWYDKRYPYYDDSMWEEGEAPNPREDGCYCDNCFYGRDKLAMELLRFRKFLHFFAEHMVLNDGPTPLPENLSKEALEYIEEIYKYENFENLYEEEDEEDE